MQSEGLTYPEVGATAGKMPAGYHAIDEDRQVGVGREWFETAADRLFSWEMQRRAGLRVEGARRVTLGAEVMLKARLGFVWLPAPVRVVAVVGDPTAVGYAYGTLAGHPERGEERFVVRLEADGNVWARIRAFSRPGTMLTRLGSPVARAMQKAITERYFAALTQER